MENWMKIQIKGIYEYEISDLGRVKSLSKSVKYSEQIIKLRLDGKGYPFVTLYGDKINPLQIRVHQLVMRAFSENANNKPCINHKDGIRTNNELSNLEWVTFSENSLDAVKRGSWIANKKINSEIVEKIRSEYKNKTKQKDLGIKYKLSQTQISRIVNNKNWK